MADTNLQNPHSETNPDSAKQIAEAAWHAAYAAYEPIHHRWDDEYEEAEKMPEGSEADAAFHQFYKVNLPTYQRARDALMKVPAPTLDELLCKMRIADKSDAEHFESCEKDLRNLLNGKR